MSDANLYGTLYLNSSTGAYTYVPNSGAINGLTAPVTENFMITVSDGTLSTNQTSPSRSMVRTMRRRWGRRQRPTYTDTPALDRFNGATGMLRGADVDLPAQTLTYGIVGATADASHGGYNQSLTGTYGTLYLNSTTGAYTFVPNNTAIDALTTTRPKTSPSRCLTARSRLIRSSR